VIIPFISRQLGKSESYFMNQPFLKKVFIIILSVPLSISAFSQGVFVISGRVTDFNKNPLQNTSIHLTGIPGGTMTKADGSFAIQTEGWSDTLELTNTGFEILKVALKKDKTTHLNLQMKSKAERLQNVLVSAKMMDKEPGKRFMKKVIANKTYNNPDRFSSYSYK